MRRLRAWEIKQAQRFVRDPLEASAAWDQGDRTRRRGPTILDTNKRRSEDLCARINGALGWRACDPERVGTVYTGSVILRERGAEVLAGLAEQQGQCPSRAVGSHPE